MTKLVRDAAPLKFPNGTSAAIEAYRTMPAQKPGRSKQDYSTPAAFISAVKSQFQTGPFAYDLAADEDKDILKGGGK